MEKLNFQDAIKSAASAASPKTKSRGPSSRGAPGRWGTAGRRERPDNGSDGTTERGAPLELGPLDLVFGGAALAADLITA